MLVVSGSSEQLHQCDRLVSSMTFLYIRRQIVTFRDVGTGLIPDVQAGLSFTVYIWVNP